jgi:hypothetical protein
MSDDEIIYRQYETISELRRALERLASMEAFSMSGAIDYSRDIELIARIDYARFILRNTK